MAAAVDPDHRGPPWPYKKHPEASLEHHTSLPSFPSLQFALCTARGQCTAVPDAAVEVEHHRLATPPYSSL